MKKTIVTQAQKLNKHLKLKTRRDGTKFYALDGYGMKTAWMTDVIHIAHGDSFPDDTIYEFIHKIAGHIAELAVDVDLYDAIDSVLDIEADVYTNQLTAWLAANLNHVQYIDEVFEEYGKPNSAFDMLQLAQMRQIREIGNALVDAIHDTL